MNKNRGSVGFKAPLPPSTEDISDESDAGFVSDLHVLAS